MLHLKVLPVLIGALAVGRIGFGCDAVAAAPNGWQQVSDKGGRCSIAVPGDWKGLIKTAPQSANQKSRAIISSSDPTTSLAQLKPIASQMMKPVRVFEDSASRYWYQFEGNEGTGTHWYVAVPAKGAVCLAQIIFKSAGDEATLKIVAKSLTVTP